MSPTSSGRAGAKSGLPNAAAEPRGGRHSWPLRTHLVLFALAMTAPLIGLIVVLVDRDSQHLSTEARYELELAGERAARQLETRLMEVVTDLLMLARTPGAHAWTSRQLNEQVGKAPSRAAIDIFRRDGSGLSVAASTVAGMPAGHSPLSERELQQLRERPFAISDRLPSSASKPDRIRVTALVPGPADDTAQHAALLSYEIAAHQLRDWLRDLPRGADAIVSDVAGGAIARTQLSPPGATATAEPFASQPVPVGATGWSIVLKASSQDLGASARQSIWLWSMVCIALGFVSCATALLLGRRLARPITELTEHARALEQGQVFAPTTSAVREADEVSLALARASVRRHEHANSELERRVAERTASLGEAIDRLRIETERKDDALAELTQSRKLEALGQLAGGVAHDFNNVLMAISGNLDLIAMRSKADPSIAQLAQNGKTAVERAARLTEQILAFSRKEPVTPEAVELSELLHGMDDMLRIAVKPSIELRIDVPAGTWPVWAEPAALQTSLLNLLLNARDAMPVGGVVTISARNSAASDAAPSIRLLNGEHVMIQVCDTGIGMSREVLARAREPFFTTKPAGKGIGLGLAMVQSFVETAGGTLTIDSSPGEGTRVCLHLPRARPGAASREAGVPVQSGSAHGTLLLVDDDEQARIATSDLLREMGYTVVEASNAGSGHSSAQAIGDLKLVISDVAMLGEDGRQLAARLALERPGLPVLLITGHEIVNESNAHVLRKPFTAAALGAKIRQLMEASEQTPDGGGGR